jgi:hypothetical protein
MRQRLQQKLTQQRKQKEAGAQQRNTKKNQPEKIPSSMVVNVKVDPAATIDKSIVQDESNDIDDFVFIHPKHLQFFYKGELVQPAVQPAVQTAVQPAASNNLGETDGEKKHKDENEKTREKIEEKIEEKVGEKIEERMGERMGESMGESMGERMKEKKELKIEKDTLNPLLVKFQLVEEMKGVVFPHPDSLDLALLRYKNLKNCAHVLNREFELEHAIDGCIDVLQEQMPGFPKDVEPAEKIVGKALAEEYMLQKSFLFSSTVTSLEFIEKPIAHAIELQKTRAFATAVQWLRVATWLLNCLYFKWFDVRCNRMKMIEMIYFKCELHLKLARALYELGIQHGNGHDRIDGNGIIDGNGNNGTGNDGNGNDGKGNDGKGNDGKGNDVNGNDDKGNGSNGNDDKGNDGKLNDSDGNAHGSAHGSNVNGNGNDLTNGELDYGKHANKKDMTLPSTNQEVGLQYLMVIAMLIPLFGTSSKLLLEPLLGLKLQNRPKTELCDIKTCTHWLDAIRVVHLQYDVAYHDHTQVHFSGYSPKPLPIKTFLIQSCYLDLCLLLTCWNREYFQTKPFKNREYAAAFATLTMVDLAVEIFRKTQSVIALTNFDFKILPASFFIPLTLTLTILLRNSYPFFFSLFFF